MLLLFVISLAVGSKMSKRLLVSSVVTIRNFYDTLSLSHKTLTRFKKKWKMFLKVWVIPYDFLPGNWRTNLRVWSLLRRISDSNGPLYRNQRYQKPRGTFRKFLFIKAAPGTRQPHFTETSWQAAHQVIGFWFWFHQSDQTSHTKTGFCSVFSFSVRDER